MFYSIYNGILNICTSLYMTQQSRTYNIIGAGPTGLALAWYLSNDGHDVIIYEKEISVGGTWRTNYIDSKYYSHHSPQILCSTYYNTFDLWNSMNIDFQKFLEKFSSLALQRILSLSALDLFHIGVGYIQFLFSKNSFKCITLSELLSNKLSKHGYDTLDALTYVIDGIPITTITAYEFYAMCDEYPLTVYQMKLSSIAIDGYSTEMKRVLSEKNNVKFHKQELDHIATSLEPGSFNLVFKNNYRKKISVNEQLILAIDPLNLVKVIGASSNIIKNNWGSWKGLQTKLMEALYIPISIQIHFKPHINIEHLERFGNETPWGIISAPLPKTTSTTNTLSCCVLNLTKTVVNNTDDEFANQIMQQLKININDIDKYTFSKGSQYNKQKGMWEFHSSSAAHSKFGHIEPKGTLNNISIVGPMNYRPMPVTTMEAATESAKLFCGKKLIKRYKISVMVGYAIFYTTLIVLIYIGIKYKVTR